MNTRSSLQSLASKKGWVTRVQNKLNQCLLQVRVRRDPSLNDWEDSRFRYRRPNPRSIIQQKKDSEPQLELL